MHRIERLPVLANHQGRKSALDRCHAACCLGVARSHAVPDSPDILPALPTFSVEKGILQIVGFIAIPPALNVHLMARLKPAVSVDGWSKLELVLAPGEHIPRKSFVLRAIFGLEREWMSHLFRGQRERQWNAVLRVAVNSVSVDLLHEISDRIR